MDLKEEVISEIENNNEEGSDRKRMSGSMSHYSPEFERLAHGEPVHQATDEEELDEQEESNEEEESATEKLRKMSQRGGRDRPFNYGPEFKRVAGEAEENRNRSRKRGNDGKSIFGPSHPDMERFQRDPNRIIDD